MDELFYWQDDMSNVSFLSLQEQPSSSSSASASSKPKPKSSKPFRQSDYNPLTGASSSSSSDGASCAWRPGRRGGNTGGG